jgi:hypothetical protein
MEKIIDIIHRLEPEINEQGILIDFTDPIEMQAVRDFEAGLGLTLPEDYTPGIGDLWDAEWYLGALYVVSEKNIYRLLDNNCLKPLSITAASSFGHLHAKDGVLWSFGTGHLAFTSDGETWNAAKSLL